MTAMTNNTKSHCEINSKFLSTLFDNALIENGRVRVGLDLASRCYQLCFLKKDQSPCNIKLSRHEFEYCLNEAKVPLYLAFEGCSGASFWKQYIESLGHKVRLVPTSYTAGVRGYKTNKSDAIDADILRETLGMSGFKECNARSLDDLCLRKLYQTLHELEKSVHSEVNRVKGLFIEIGYEAPVIRTVDDCLNAIEGFKKNAEELNKKLRGVPVQIVEDCQQALMLMMIRKNNLIKSIIVPMCNNDRQCCELLQSIPGINYYLALLLKLNISDIQRFKSARDLAAYLGFYPAHSGTGGKIKMGRMSHGGDPILKGTVYEAALALMHQGKGKKNQANKPRSTYIESMQEKHKDLFKKSAVVISNKLIRVVYGVLSKGERYNPEINKDLGPCKKNKRQRASEQLHKRWRLEASYLQRLVMQLQEIKKPDEIESKGFLRAYGIEEHLELQGLDLDKLADFIKHEERVTAHNKQSRESAQEQKSERRLSSFINEVIKNPRVLEGMKSA